MDDGGGGVVVRGRRGEGGRAPRRSCGTAEEDPQAEIRMEEMRRAVGRADTADRDEDAGELPRRTAAGHGHGRGQEQNGEDDVHHEQLRMVGVLDLPAIPVPLGGGGVLQGAEADAPAGRFPREQRERSPLAGLDGAAGLSPAPLHRLAEQMEAPVLQAVHASAGRAVELFQDAVRARMLRHAA